MLGTLTLLAAFVALPVQTAGAEEQRQRHDGIFITDERDFNPANGVRSGSGTAADPYVISGWDTRYIFIKDTSSHVVITDNVVSDLVIDWAGGGIHVHHNEVGDLRVNQNVKRTGDPTSGKIVHNTFDVVGQLRHFDGVFAHNVVGTKDDTSPWELLWRRRAVNFDGFNGAVFEDNVIYGYMDARLHGHHHSSSFSGDSHYHGGAAEHEEMVDHSKRYHQVWIRNNTIHATGGYALAYLDTAHAANDRTAASEREEDLNKPHVHHTRVNIQDNKLVGSGLLVDVFNAKDERHLRTARGSVLIEGNDITMVRDQMSPSFRQLHGITVQRAQDITLDVIGNHIRGPQKDQMELPYAQWWDADTGILLSGLDDGLVRLYGNSVMDRSMAIQARDMSASVRWIIGSLSTKNVEHDVYWDRSVKNPPERRD